MLWAGAIPTRLWLWSFAMTDAIPFAEMMRTLRFHTLGEPADVLCIDKTAPPGPYAGAVSVRVRACGLNPADWALCRGLFQGDLPRGVGLDVSGTVTAVGEGVRDVAVGDAVFGAADYVNFPTAGASDYAVLNHWAAMPPGLGFIEAAALPLVVETASRYIALLNPQPGQTLLINGAGTMVGFAAVQMALLKGVKVVATAGPALTPALCAFGALVTPHGPGLVERISDLLESAPDHVLDVAPVNLTPEAGVASALPDLIKVVGDDAQRVVTVADFAGAAATGARTGMEGLTSMADVVMHWDKLGEYAQHTAEGRFRIPVAQTFPLEDWRKALDISLAGRAHGKLVLAIALEAGN